MIKNSSTIKNSRRSIEGSGSVDTTLNRTVIEEESDERDEYNRTNLEENPQQVLQRLRNGCGCQQLSLVNNCFANLNPENVYKHRLNIAELTKSEHDMYLMGVIMASLSNPLETIRHKERKRQRATYVYQGKRVCLEAFLYLENLTQYQLKRIRKHVVTYGVAPRTHGNSRKKPHNRIPLDQYKKVENFLKEFLINFTNDLTKPINISGTSRSSVYKCYKEYAKDSQEKLIGGTTFRHFMKERFPNVKFITKVEHSKPMSSS